MYLVSEEKLQKIQKKVYKSYEGRLFKKWSKYDRGDYTARQLLNSLSILQRKRAPCPRCSSARQPPCSPPPCSSTPTWRSPACPPYVKLRRNYCNLYICRYV